MEIGGRKISRRDGKGRMDGEMEQSADMSSFNWRRILMMLNYTLFKKYRQLAAAC